MSDDIQQITGLEVKDIPILNDIIRKLKRDIDDKVVVEHAITRGFELGNNSTDADHDIDVFPGTLYHGELKVNNTTTTVIQLDSASDWIDGSAYSYSGGAGMCYVYVNTDGDVRFEETAPAYADTDGNTAGTKLYHKENADYWRLIGAVLVATDDTIDAFYQVGDWIIYKVFIQELTNGTATSYTDIDCTSSVPVFSQLAQFRLIGAVADTSYLRMNGSTSPQLSSTEAEQNSGLVALDSSQVVEYDTIGGGVTNVWVCGYYVGAIR